MICPSPHTQFGLKILVFTIKLRTATFICRNFVLNLCRCAHIFTYSQAFKFLHIDEAIKDSEEYH